MRCFVEALAHPEKSYPIIHVAGTNGKGSVCAMLEAIYRANNFRTGLYTSPHLIRQGERVQVNRSIIEEAEIVKYTKLLRPIAEKLGEKDIDDQPSFFEFMTAMAFLRFAEASVDIAILETGLGGRLDSTNVVTPELSIITSIGLDHIEQLGDTIEKIAAEKAGIIKQDIPVVIGRLPSKAEIVIREIAAERNSKLYSVKEYFDKAEALPETNLSGSFQKWNAGTALLATEILKNSFPLTQKSPKDALKKVDWRGRWETITLDDRTLILDATHNAEGVQNLKEQLTKHLAETGKKPVIVAAALGKLRARALIPVVAHFAKELHLIAPDQERATSTTEMATFLPVNSTLQVIHNTIETIIPKPRICSLGKPGDTIIITGSLYLIGEILGRFDSKQNSQNDLQDLP